MQALDPEQLVLRGTAVVEASAGTGKTYTITSLFLRLLLEQELSVDQILVVTYTRAATAELRDRIRKRLAVALALARGEPVEDPLLSRLESRCEARVGRARLVALLEEAMAGLDEAPVLTIHGFCQRVLRDHAFESGAAFEAQLTTHAGPLLDEIADDYFMRELYETTPFRAGLLLGEREVLRGLAARVGGRGLRVLPEESEELPFDEAAFARALAACRALWSSHEARIVELASSVKSIGKNAVNAAPRIGKLLKKGDPDELVKLKTFASFTRSGLLAKGKGVAPAHPFFEAADELLSLARDFGPAKTSVELNFRRRFVDYLERELARRTRESHVRTFDALLVDLDAALSGPRGGRLGERLRERYRAALVDEFQDTDPMQYRIFRRIFAHDDTTLLLIGDPKQAIYGFRGADVAAYLGARAEAGERVYTLDVNWRADPRLIAALNALYGQVERPFLRDEIVYRRVQPPASAHDRLRASDDRAPIDLAIVRSEGESAETLRRKVARHVASDIAALLAASRGRGALSLAGAPLAASDIAVLCRTNNDAALVQQALSERGVPSVRSGDASVFDSEDVPQLERALTALAHPTDARALRAFLASIYGGHDARMLVELEEDDARWEWHRARFQQLHETWLTHGFMPALRGLVVGYEIEKRLLARTDGTRRITNLWHLAELLAEAAMSERLGPLGLLRWLSLVQHDQARRSELSGDAHELRLESSEDAVTLTTVHKSKGLEYPIVYCPFAWDAARLHESERKMVRFHDPEREALTLDLGSSRRDAHEALAKEEALAEALRLLYVALTRAKHRVTVLIPESEKFAESALGYTLFGGGERDELSARLTERVRAGELFGALSARVEVTESAFSVRPLTPQSSPRYVAKAIASGELEARTARRSLDQSYRVSSFSALVARERTPLGEAGIDRDALAEEVAPALPPEGPSPLALGDFPRGTVAGQLIHEVLEHADFDGSREGLTRVAERVVRARGYDAALVPSLVTGLTRALATPLDGDALSLSRVARGDRIDEMEFVFPIVKTLTPRLLERTFRAQQAPSALPSYAGSLRDLSFDALHGFLRGFIDLVFRHEGRFYVVDYKSNWLGPMPEDYAPDKLPHAMADHHYFLQYHLYTVAVHRYLARRVPGYDYAQHFGGVYYLFLRGMDPSHPPGTGVFSERPREELVAGLDALLGQATEVAP